MYSSPVFSSYGLKLLAERSAFLVPFLAVLGVGLLLVTDLLLLVFDGGLAGLDTAGFGAALAAGAVLATTGLLVGADFFAGAGDLTAAGALAAAGLFVATGLFGATGLATTGALTLAAGLEAGLAAVVVLAAGFVAGLAAAVDFVAGLAAGLVAVLAGAADLLAAAGLAATFFAPGLAGFAGALLAGFCGVAALFFAGIVSASLSWRPKKFLIALSMLSFEPHRWQAKYASHCRNLITGTEITRKAGAVPAEIVWTYPYAGLVESEP